MSSTSRSSAEVEGGKKVLSRSEMLKKISRKEVQQQGVVVQGTSSQGGVVVQKGSVTATSSTKNAPVSYLPTPEILALSEQYKDDTETKTEKVEQVVTGTSDTDFIVCSQGGTKTTRNTYLTNRQLDEIHNPPSDRDRDICELFMTGSIRSLEISSRVISIVDSFTDLKKGVSKDDLLHYLWQEMCRSYGIPVDSDFNEPKVSGAAKVQLAKILKDIKAKKTLKVIEYEIVVLYKDFLSLPSNAEKQSTTILSLITLLDQCSCEWLRNSIRRQINARVSTYGSKFWEYLLQHEYLIPRNFDRNIKLYDFQERVIEMVQRTSPFFLKLAMPPNTGKTFLSASLPKYTGEKIVVFCCVVQEVYLTVAKLSSYMGFSPTFVYGKGTSHSIILDKRFKGTDFFESRDNNAVEYLKKTFPKNARMMICDIESCVWLMAQLRRSNKDFVLFLDEPTMGCDSASKEIPTKISEILAFAPKQIILSSATLPNDLTPITDDWKARHGDGGAVESIGYDTRDKLVTSSIQLIDMETGKLIMPHSICTNRSDLIRFVSELPLNISYLKAYSGSVILEMRKAMIDLEIPCQSLGWFDVFDLSLQKIREYAVVLLSQVIRCRDDEKVAQFLSYESESLYPPVNLDDLPLGYSPYVPGETLLVSKTPITQANQISSVITEPIDFDAVTKLIKNHDKIIKSLRSRKDREDVAQPRLVPDVAIIHSLAHLSAYGNLQDKFPREFLRHIPGRDYMESVMELNATEWEKKGLISGVVHTSGEKASSYAEMVSKVMSDGVSCPIAVVDENYTYGVNVPASNTIVTDEFAETHSKNTIIQFVNRVNRSGSKTHNGKAFLSRQAKVKFLSADDGLEAHVLLECFNSVCQRRDSKKSGGVKAT